MGVFWRIFRTELRLKTIEPNSSTRSFCCTIVKSLEPKGSNLSPLRILIVCQDTKWVWEHIFVVLLLLLIAPSSLYSAVNFYWCFIYLRRLLCHAFYRLRNIATSANSALGFTICQTRLSDHLSLYQGRTSEVGSNSQCRRPTPRKLPLCYSGPQQG